jgi:hypothetical protein
VILALLLAPGALAAQQGSGGWADTSGAVAGDLAYLASDARDRRGTGTPGNQRAPALPPCPPIFFQSFRPPADILTQHHLSTKIVAASIGALVPGSDPLLRRDVVILGESI